MVNTVSHKIAMTSETSVLENETKVTEPLPSFRTRLKKAISQKILGKPKVPEEQP
jgi:hypothetical protein